MRELAARRDLPRGTYVVISGPSVNDAVVRAEADHLPGVGPDSLNLDGLAHSIRRRLKRRDDRAGSNHRAIEGLPAHERVGAARHVGGRGKGGAICLDSHGRHVACGPCAAVEVVLECGHVLGLGRHECHRLRGTGCVVIVRPVAELDRARLVACDNRDDVAVLGDVGPLGRADGAVLHGGLERARLGSLLLAARVVGLALHDHLVFGQLVAVAARFIRLLVPALLGGFVALDGLSLSVGVVHDALDRDTGCRRLLERLDRHVNRGRCDLAPGLGELQLHLLALGLASGRAHVEAVVVGTRLLDELELARVDGIGPSELAIAELDVDLDLGEVVLLARIDLVGASGRDRATVIGKRQLAKVGVALVDVWVVVPHALAQLASVEGERGTPGLEVLGAPAAHTAQGSAVDIGCEADVVVAVGALRERATTRDRIGLVSCRSRAYLARVVGVLDGQRTVLVAHEASGVLVTNDRAGGKAVVDLDGALVRLNSNKSAIPFVARRALVVERAATDPALVELDEACAAHIAQESTDHVTRSVEIRIGERAPERGNRRAALCLVAHESTLSAGPLEHDIGHVAVLKQKIVGSLGVTDVDA